MAVTTEQAPAQAAQPQHVPGYRPFGRLHILQSLAAGLFILLAFLALGQLQSGLTIASLGASAFIAFSFPSTRSSQARFLIGGYCVGAVTGLVGFWLIRLLEGISLPVPAHIPGCAVTVFLAMLLMTSLNFEHPPSAALAIAVATSHSPVLLGLGAMGCMLVLCLVRHLLRGWLENL